VTALGEPLAIFDDVALCDRRDHELRLVTDGQRAYVYPLSSHAQVSEDTTCSRVGVTLTARCPVAMGLGESEQCDGEVSWRIDRECWTSDADSRRLLAAYGRNVEQ
jgi:hypothetical protein